MNIIFMGTPDFACPSLQAIIDAHQHNISAVFTAMPKKQGRGMKETRSAIHELALKNKLTVHTPSTLRTDEVLQLINSIEADVIIVAAYGFIVPPAILAAKKYGCLNIHPSKLPKYRGAAPLQRTIINGDMETAICIMQMDAGLDTGDIILQHDLALSKETTLKELHDKAASLGAQLLLETLDNINSLPRIKQIEEGVSYAHKLSKEEGRVLWSDSAEITERKFRGMSIWPGIYFTHNDKQIKILECEVVQLPQESNPERGNDYSYGTVIDNKYCIVLCGHDALKITLLKPEGKQAMSGSDYLRGLKNDKDLIIFS